MAHSSDFLSGEDLDVIMEMLTDDDFAEELVIKDAFHGALKEVSLHCVRSIAVSFKEVESVFTCKQTLSIYTVIKLCGLQL